jgi:hypothetical protein
MKIQRTDAMRRPLPPINAQIKTIQGNLYINTDTESWILDLDSFMQMVETYLGGETCEK